MINDKSIPLHDNLIPPFEEKNSDNDRIPIDTGKRVLNKYFVGDMIGQYVIEEEIVEGALGAVYRCRDIMDGSQYAIKTVMPCDATHDGVELLMKELHKMACLPSHANVTYLHYSFVKNDIPHMVMSYFRGVQEEGRFYGTSLKQLINNGIHFTIYDTIWIATQICRGLAHCQANISDFVHGDIKPGNILFEPIDEPTESDDGLIPYRVLISDFGIGSKTHGYYLSAFHEPATKEDDIYAFAKTMENIIHLGKNFERDAIYWRPFIAGIDDLLYRDNSHQIRESLSFNSLFHGYAEALEYMFGISHAEDVLPEFRENDQSRIVKIINRANYFIQIEKNKSLALELLSQLIAEPCTEKVFFDDLPASVLIRLQIAHLYFTEQNWQSFNQIMESLQPEISSLPNHIKYKGRYVYSNNLHHDIFILNQMSRLLRGEIDAADNLIRELDWNDLSRDWLEPLLSVIYGDTLRLKTLENKLYSLSQYTDLNDPQYIDFNFILGLVLIYLCKWQEALPFIKIAYTANRDGTHEGYLYALCLYNTGEIINAMMYFERVYDIYMIDHSFQSENSQLIRYALFSLYYMCDFSCLQSQCEMLRLFNHEMALKVLDSDLTNLEELGSNSKELLDGWRMREYRMRNKLVELNETLSFLHVYRKRFDTEAAQLSEGSIYNIINRASVQVYLEASRLLAENLIDNGQLVEAIKVGEEILLIDKSYYSAHYFMGGSYFSLYMLEKEECLKTKAKKSFTLARKYVHAMYPGKRGTISQEAEYNLKKIQEYENKMDL